MSDFAELVATLFSPPGEPSTATSELLSRAAAAHERLLESATASHPTGAAATEILALLRAPPLAGRRRDLLCDPLLVSSLHRLSRASPVLARWHRAVASPGIAEITCRGNPSQRSCLGHLLLALRLQADSSWCGEILLETDSFGRLEFPGCDWLLVLSCPRDGPRGILASQRVVVTVGQHRVRWALVEKVAHPFLEMPRDDCLRMLVGNEDGLEVDRIIFPSRDMRPALLRKSRIPGSVVRYDPVSFEHFASHAPLTGGIVTALLGAMRQCSPVVAGEFDALIRTVRGFEVRELAAGTIQSFSDPSLPGVMSINMPFTESHEPRLSPLCFTWFGHEMGHTKSYLIETILHDAGKTLLKNARQSTQFLPRYGRTLRVRTLLQIPYTHLYEWLLLADFLECGFPGLPWPVTENPLAAAEDLAREIDESFALIDAEAELTPAGSTVIAHLRNLHKNMISRWDGLVTIGMGGSAAIGATVIANPAITR